MNRDEALTLLLGGPERATEWNRRRLYGETIPDLGGADLRGADLRGADLRGADLRGANLQESMLVRADISRADLTGATLTGAFLPGALLFATDLRGAGLRGASLQEGKLFNTDLREADLREANLTFASLVRCNLDDAVFDEADVTNCHVQESVGRPKIPRLLRVEGYSPLTDEDLRDFFNPPAVVEVYLTEVLTDEDLGAFHFHLGDMRLQGVGVGVHLTRERVEAGGTILRFQGPTYGQIYEALPVLLKPFRMSRAVDWAKTYESLLEQDRDAVLSTLAKIEAEDPGGRWRFAERMAEILGNFPGARVTHLRDGRNLGVRIEVATNERMYRKLAGLGQGSRLSPLAKQQIFYLPAGVQPKIGTGNTANARDIDSFINSVDQANLDTESKRVLVEARRELESGCLTGVDRDDVTDDLGKLAEEITKPEPHPGRVKRLFERIEQITPEVASVLASMGNHTIERHTRVEFPKTCRKDVGVELVLQLTIQAPTLTLVSKSIDVPFVENSSVTVLTVRVTAPTFRLNRDRARLSVPVDRDSEPVRFELTPLEEGLQLIEVELFHGCDRVGYLTILSEVMSDGR